MIDGEKKKFSIDRVNQNILNSNKKNYHQMFLNIDEVYIYKSVNKKLGRS